MRGREKVRGQGTVGVRERLRESKRERGKEKKKKISVQLAVLGCWRVQVEIERRFLAHHE